MLLDLKVKKSSILLAVYLFSMFLPGYFSSPVMQMVSNIMMVGVAIYLFSVKYKPSRFMTAGGQIVPVRQKGFAACDILLTPALEGYAATDILRKDNMYDLGYECARSRMEEVRSLLKNAKAAKAR